MRNRSPAVRWAVRAALGAALPLAVGAAAGLGLGGSLLARELPTAPGQEPAFPLPPSPLIGRLPPGFPSPAVPVDNPLTAAKVELGRYLFYDRRLSGDGDYACASCHRQALAFTDGRARAVGTTGELHPRSAMSLANAAYNVTLGWDDPELVRLEDQALVPMLHREPIELGIAGHEDEVLARFAADPLYRRLLAAAFPGAESLTLDRAVAALASFGRTLISGRSAYDRLLYDGDSEALSDAAWRGMHLFFSRRLGCSGCHAGFNFSGPVRFSGPGRSAAAEPRPAFFNTGLYDVDGTGAYPPANPGLSRFTGRSEDQGRFRAPTLRNVALTAPYMHDGSIPSLGEVIEHYAAAGRAAGNRYKDERITGFALAPGEKEDLIAFLESLTDPGLLTDPTLSDPFAGGVSEPVSEAVGSRNGTE